MKNQDNKPKTVTGVDESGMFCITRPKFRPADLLILFLLFLALFSNGQNVETKDGGKTYTSVSKPKQTAPAVNTGKIYKDSKGKEYPIMKSEGGAYYYLRTSAKGNIYKAYLKLN